MTNPLHNVNRLLPYTFVADPVSPLCAKKCIRLLSGRGWPSLVKRALSPGGPMDALDLIGNPRMYDFGKPYGVRHPLSVRSLWHVAVSPKFSGVRPGFFRQEDSPVLPLVEYPAGHSTRITVVTRIIYYTQYMHIITKHLHHICIS